MSFQFIDHAAITADSRKLIRKHVMKGKNSGKTRVFKHGNRKTFHMVSADSKGVTGIVGMKRETPIDLLLALGHGLSGIMYPFDMTGHKAQMIQQFLRFMKECVFPPAFCHEFDIMNSVWFDYLILDEAYFHGILAFASATIDFARQSNSHTTESNRYLGSALSIINKRLAGADGLSDSTLAVVISLCLVEIARQKPQQAQLHFNGLCRMIDMRGGIACLTNYDLAEKSHRLDVELALQLGQPPRLQRMIREIGEICPTQFQETQPTSPFLRSFKDQDCEKYEAAQEFVVLSRVLNSKERSDKLDPFVFQDLILTIVYRLLSENPISAPVSGRSPDRALHLGLLAFITTCMTQFGGSHHLDYEMLRQSLLVAMCEVGISVNMTPKTRLWLLITGVISVFREEDMKWVSTQLQEIESRINIKNWAAVKRALKGYPWLDLVHEEPAVQLWEKCSKQVGK